MARDNSLLSPRASHFVVTILVEGAVRMFRTKVNQKQFASEHWLVLVNGVARRNFIRDQIPNPGYMTFEGLGLADPVTMHPIRN